MPLGKTLTITCSLTGGLVYLSQPLAAQETQTAPPVDESLMSYADTSDLVTLADGRKLHFICMGEGSPTIILTPAATMSANAWGNIQPELGRISRTCAWDRPGFGFSDGVSEPQTVVTTTRDLAAGLAAGGISAPYVLVGHSAGAFEPLLFADAHPGEVAGMVLVDPSFPGQSAFVARTSPLMAETDKAFDAVIAFFNKCAADAGSGAIEPGGADPNDCFSYPPSFPEKLSTALAKHAADHPQTFASVGSFMGSFAANSELVVNPDRDYADMPLVVLTAIDRSPPPGTSPELAEEMARFDVVWNSEHDKLAALSSRGVNARIPGANHAIQLSKPQALIDAVNAVVALARGNARQ